MKKLATHAVLAASMLLVSGCTAPDPVPSEVADPAQSAPQPIASSTPTFLQLDEAAAASRYLDLVCPSNAAIRDLVAAYDAGEQEMLNGGEPDATAARAAAARRLELNRQTLTLIDDPYYVWPASITTQIQYVRDTYVAELSTLDAMANAASFQDAYYSTFPEATPEQRAAGQEIRYTLGIDADTVASCVDHETGVEALTASYNERLAQAG